MFFRKQLDDGSVMGSLDDHLGKDECCIDMAPASPDLKTGRRLSEKDSPFIQ